MLASESDVQHQANVFHVGTGKVFQNWNEIQELVVMRIREPTADWDRVLGVEDIRSWRVVDDNGVFEVTSNLRKVFDVVSLVVVATLAE